MGGGGSVWGWEAEGSQFEPQCARTWKVFRCTNTFIALLKYPWPRYRHPQMLTRGPCDRLGSHIPSKGVHVNLTIVCMWWRREHRRAVSLGSVSERPKQHSRTTRRPTAADPSAHNLQGCRKHTAPRLGQRTAENNIILGQGYSTAKKLNTEKNRKRNYSLCANSWDPSWFIVRTELKLREQDSLHIFEIDTQQLGRIV